MAREENLFGDGRFGERLNTRGANLEALAVNFGPLEVHLFAVAIDGIVITTQKFAFVGHHGFFTASRASACHNSTSISEECHFFKSVVTF